MMRENVYLETFSLVQNIQRFRRSTNHKTVPPLYTARQEAGTAQLDQILKAYNYLNRLIEWAVLVISTYSRQKDTYVYTFTATVSSPIYNMGMLLYLIYIPTAIMYVLNPVHVQDVLNL